MATSKKDKSRANKVEKFKEGAKKEAAFANTPRTHLIPQTEWQSTDTLDMRGDLAQHFEIELVKAYEAVQKVGQIFSEMMSLNMGTGKVKLTYIWNNGEKPTEKEVEDYKLAVQFMQQERQKQMNEIQDRLQKTAQDNVNASKSGLVTADGQPLTEENLEKSKSGLIV